MNQQQAHGYAKSKHDYWQDIKTAAVWVCVSYTVIQILFTLWEMI